jgi:hypothetical protein
MIDHLLPCLVATAYLGTALWALLVGCRRNRNPDRLLFAVIAATCFVWSSFYLWASTIAVSIVSATLARSLQAFTIATFALALAFRGREK